MTLITWPGNQQWPLWQKILFRFFFFYFVIYISPWSFLGYIPYAETVTDYYYQFVNWAVHSSNKYLFHGYKTLINPNGSGDTSFNWTQVWLYLLLSAIICVCWSVLDRKRQNYNQLGYWLRIVVRYFLILNCFNYGIIKLFCLQMPFPNMSQLATPVGDFLPMRLSWMFMGYSTTYQMFSGAMEILAGVLMMWRRTTTFGTLLAAGIFANVMIMNLSYDIPVKLFSIHLFLMCMLLLAFESKRISSFFLMNKITAAGNLYHVMFPKKWMRLGRIVLKCFFLLMIAILPFISILDNYKQVNNLSEIKPIRSGMYDVELFVLNADTISLQTGDTLRWKDVIFERGGAGSINTTDTTFRQRYRRGYFNYSTDTVKQEIIFTKSNMMGETSNLFQLHYQMPDSITIQLRGMIRKDSIFAVLKRNNRHFQLAERQFHWLSEYNR